jgi:hypothetical protein
VLRFLVAACPTLRPQPATPPCDAGPCLPAHGLHVIRIAARHLSLLFVSAELAAGCSQGGPGVCEAAGPC